MNSPFAARADSDSGTETAYGSSALNNDFIFQYGEYCSGFGYEAGANGTGSFNTSVGAYAGYGTTDFPGEGDSNPDCDGSQNTATGYATLFSYYGGSGDTATGYESLYSDTDGSNNTATGANALYSNTEGNFLTATGASALYSNTTGVNNTATGVNALYGNMTGAYLTATGMGALGQNTQGSNSTATGYNALGSNTTGNNSTADGINTLYYNLTGNGNTALGAYALQANTSGSNNQATGLKALYANTTGQYNDACGYNALVKNTTGSYNTGDGYGTLAGNTTGGSNTALGHSAGASLTTGSNNIDIANAGVAAEAATIRIGTKSTQTNTYLAGVSGVTVAGGVGVVIDTNGHLGTVTSSERFKDGIVPMAKASDELLALKPVAFHYKPELDPQAIPQYGLVAEQVAQVDPNLVARDADGKIYTVRYDAVNAMLLNEFLKEHGKVEAQQSTIDQQQATLAAQQVALAEQHAINSRLEGALAALASTVDILKAQRFPANADTTGR